MIAGGSYPRGRRQRSSPRQGNASFFVGSTKGEGGSGDRGSLSSPDKNASYSQVFSGNPDAPRLYRSKCGAFGEKKDQRIAVEEGWGMWGVRGEGLEGVGGGDTT